ncbi:hypothetical protein [Actinoplanes sp. NPDC051859]|uniref:hypothetical protein n=1 Tax=Actinoplanes sp. NPDC051859 TaxID=3363909 RepID=UPI0037AF6643
MRSCRLSSLFVAVVLAVVVAPAAPASAATALRLNTVLEPITIAPGTPENSFEANLHGVLAQREVPARPHRITYAIDLTEVSDLIEFTFAGFNSVDVVAAATDESPCKLRLTVLHCRRTGITPTAGWIIQLGDFLVNPTSAAQKGDAGRIKVTAQVDDGPVTTSTSQVRIGESVNLSTLGNAKVAAAPGRTVRVASRVRNVGKAPVKGTVLQISPADPRLIGTDARNCFYAYQVFCGFDTVLQPGRTYALRTPLSLLTPGDAAAGSRTYVGLSWLTLAAYEDLKTRFPSIQGKPGRGAPLTLVPLANSAEVPQVDVNEGNDNATVTFTVKGARRPALVASVPAAHVAPGKTATMRFGVTNRGPGTLYPQLFPDTQTIAWLTLPKGVTVAKADKRCFGTGGREWVCYPGDSPLAAGRARTFVFRLTAAKGFTGGSARVRFEGELLGTTRKLRISAASSGAGGGLAISGPTVLPGLLLVVLGAALLRLGRRPS